VLDCGAVRRAFGIVLDDWLVSLERVMEEVREVRQVREIRQRAEGGPQARGAAGKGRS